MTRACADEEMDGPPSPLPYNSCLGNQKNHPSPDVSRRLPAELLASVFIRIARDYVYGQYIYFKPLANGPSWVDVSYVCRYWRDVALNCPTLWSYIPAMSQRWTQELLARSQMVPLKINTKAFTMLSSTATTRQEMKVRRALSIVDQVMNHSQRIQKLCFTGSSIVNQETAYLYQILSKFLFTHLPCLQHLEISDFDLAERKSLLLCGENTPALRSLRLNHCWMPSWYALGPSFLRTLHLFDVGIYANKMVDFLAMLRRMPNLVQLCVNGGSIPNDFLSNGELLSNPVIDLPHLSHMSIVMASDSLVSTAIALLSCVEVPLKTKVHLECTHYVSTPDDYVRLASLLGQRISQSDSPKFRSLTIGSRKRLALAFSTSERAEYHSPDSFFSIGSDDSALLKVIFSSTHTPMDALEHRVWNGICSQIPLTNVQSVNLLGSSLEPDFWRDMLALFSDVRYIRISHDQMPNITSMLSLPSPHLTRSWQDGRPDRGQSEIFVPALEELVLYRTTLEGVRGRSRSDPNPCVAGVEDLYDAIATRKETRCQLTIKECRLVTDKGIIALESVGWWEGDQFRVTSHV